MHCCTCTRRQTHTYQPLGCRLKVGLASLLAGLDLYRWFCNRGLRSTISPKPLVQRSPLSALAPGLLELQMLCGVTCVACCLCRVTCAVVGRVPRATCRVPCGLCPVPRAVRRVCAMCRVPCAVCVVVRVPSMRRVPCAACRVPRAVCCVPCAGCLVLCVVCPGRQIGNSSGGANDSLNGATTSNLDSRCTWCCELRLFGQPFIAPAGSRGGQLNEFPKN